MSRHHDMRKFSVTERVNDDNSDYYDEIRRSRSLTRKPVGNRPQSVDYSESENPKIKIRYSVKGVPIKNDSSSRSHHHHHSHKKDSSSPTKTSLTVKKKPRSVSISVRRETIDLDTTKSPSRSNSRSHHHSSSHHRKDKNEESKRGINDDESTSRHHHHSHSKDTKKSSSDKKKIPSIERHYDEDNSIINYDEDSKKKRSKHRKNENINQSMNKENNTPNKINERRNKKLPPLGSITNEEDSISMSSFSINQKHREKRLKDKVRSRDRDRTSSRDDKSHKSHSSKKSSSQRPDRSNKEPTIRKSNSNNIVPTYPPPMSPSLKKSSLKYSKSVPLEKGGSLSEMESGSSPETLPRNRSLSRSRSVSISNQVSVVDENEERPNLPLSNSRVSSSMFNLPLYKSTSESIRELRENVLHKYASSEMLSPESAQNKSNKAPHTSEKRSVSNDTSKLRYSHTLEDDEDEPKKERKSRSQSLSKSSKHKKKEKKSKEKPEGDYSQKEKGNAKGNDNSMMEKKKEKHCHKKDRSPSKDPTESILSNSSNKDKKIKRHANVPAPKPPEDSIKDKPLPKSPKKEDPTDDSDLAIKPVKPVKKETDGKKEFTTFYPEGYAPSIDDSVKTKINEEDEVSSEINPEKKKSKHSHSRSRTKSHSRSQSRHHHKSRSRSKSKSKSRNASVDFENDLSKDDSKKHSRRHKSKNRENTSDENSTINEKVEDFVYEKNIFENLKKKPEDFKNSNICVHIYRTDALELNIRNVHPLVKVHIIDINTEQYLTKSSALRPATSYYENSEIEFIMPILTQPYNLQKNHTNIPRWNQGLYINEDYLHVVRKNIVIFFEIMDFVERAHDRKKDKDGWHRIAWAFLKLVGTHGLVNTEHTRRLQLYKYPKKLIKSKDPKKPEIIEYWKQKLNKYQSTLFVKVYSQKLPEVKEVSYRPRMPNEKEIGTWTYDQLMDTYFSKKKILDPVYKSFINFSQKPSWRREDGQLCKIPNHLHFRIDGGERGCLAAEYSHLGYLFAVGSTSLNSVTTIKIFDTVSGDKIASLTGHQDLVYDIKWSRDDKHLFSASADGSVRAWSIQSETSIRSSAIFQHPSYVYCIQIHPIMGPDKKITVITGSYDGKIRFWKYDQNLYNDIELSKQPHHQTQFLPAYVLTGHDATVNSLAIESSGIRLFSADGKGYIRVWSCRVNDSIGYDNYKCIKVIPTQSDPINCIRLHPNERQLLVHCMGNTIYMMDIRLFKVLTCITTLPSNQYPIKSILSPCGTYIFSGSSDGKVYVWNSMTGNLVAKYENLTISQPILGIAYHPLDDYISFYTYGPEQPILTYVWDSNYKSLESGLKITSEEDNKANKMFDLTTTKIIDDEKKFPFSRFNNNLKNFNKKQSEEEIQLPNTLRKKQGLRGLDENLLSKTVYI